MKEFNNNHYSEQTGHFLRGQTSRTRTSFERVFPEIPFVKPEPLQMQKDMSYLIRRKMNRVPRNGK